MDNLDDIGILVSVELRCGGCCYLVADEEDRWLCSNADFEDDIIPCEAVSNEECPVTAPDRDERG